MLTDQDLAEITRWRRRIHSHPELPGEEEHTARAVCEFIAADRPDSIVPALGGHGVAVVFKGPQPGPTVLLRAELDALPIQELSDVPHRSVLPGKAHLCGHDGHSATLLAIGRMLGRERPQRGRIILMFQPAEENGAGAAAVIADPKFAALAPDISFSWHNMPGLPFGHASVIEGPMSCASRGMRISLHGKTAHASQPQNGVSPRAALAELLAALHALNHDDGGADLTMATITHCQMGAPAFGVAPADAEIWTTLRTLTDDRMAALVERAEALAQAAAQRHELTLAIDYHDIFAHVENAPVAVAHIRRALDAAGVPHGRDMLPMRPSEDFGRFGHRAPAAMFLLGAAERHASLHNPDYDFPDALIPIGADVMLRAARQVLEQGI